ncbi:MAG: LuxR C-terminal-related transcriptional regulator [Salinivirgaceae bacterium]|jgi:DNA-binding CsgD family transcriptional regulator
MLVEFFKDPSGRNLVINDLTKDEFRIFNNEDKEVINLITDKIEEDYPEAYERLKQHYWNGAERKYMLVARFLRCNFSKNDHEPDIDDDGNLCLERVECPLKGLFCKDYQVICEPKLNTTISDREKDVAILYATGLSVEEVGERLFISPNTVRNHRQRIFKKLNIHAKSDLVNWAYKNKLM